jgi:hypothetical protein
MPPSNLWLCAVLLIAFASPAAAGCGAAFCSLNTDWGSQGGSGEPGGRFDLRYEFIDQDQPRSGTRDVGLGELPRHHDERRTINRNLVAGFDYAFDERWSMAIAVPVVSRSHLHDHHHHGAVIEEAWSFARTGDARLSGRYRVTRGNAGGGAFGVQLGLKLPTGAYDLDNEDGDRAERSLQPGSGTTDAILGAFVNGRRAGQGTWFAEAMWQPALDRRDGYKPGTRVAVDAGLAHPLGARLQALLQLNALYRVRDGGAEAEPEDTGGSFVHLSPGLGWDVDERFRLYGFVQLPLYQHVNGVQLVADWALVAGLSRRF